MGAAEVPQTTASARDGVDAPADDLRTAVAARAVLRLHRAQHRSTRTDASCGCSTSGPATSCSTSPAARATPPAPWWTRSGPTDSRSASDSSATMLAQAVRDTPPGSPVGYVRADAVDLPFDDATFDAVSCYGALYLMDDPFGALREMIRVLAPGGRIAVLTTCARGPAPVRRIGCRRVAVGAAAALRRRRDHRRDARRRAGRRDPRRDGRVADGERAASRDALMSNLTSATISRPRRRCGRLQFRR